MDSLLSGRERPLGVHPLGNRSRGWSVAFRRFALRLPQQQADREREIPCDYFSSDLLCLLLLLSDDYYVEGDCGPMHLSDGAINDHLYGSVYDCLHD